MTGIDYILYRASLNFSFTYQCTFFPFILLTLFILRTLYCVFTLFVQYIQSARKDINIYGIDIGFM